MAFLQDRFGFESHFYYILGFTLVSYYMLSGLQYPLVSPGDNHSIFFGYKKVQIETTYTEHKIQGTLVSIPISSYPNKIHYNQRKNKQRRLYVHICMHLVGDLFIYVCTAVSPNVNNQRLSM